MLPYIAGAAVGAILFALNVQPIIAALIGVAVAGAVLVLLGGKKRTPPFGTRSLFLPLSSSLSF
jgi:hypothetical protein